MTHRSLWLVISRHGGTANEIDVQQAPYETSDEADSQLSPKPTGNLLKRLHRGIPVAILESAEVRLLETATLGELLLAQSLRQARAHDTARHLALELLIVPLLLELGILELPCKVVSEVTHFFSPNRLSSALLI